LQTGPKGITENQYIPEGGIDHLHRVLEVRQAKGRQIRDDLAAIFTVIPADQNPGAEIRGDDVPAVKAVLLRSHLDQAAGIWSGIGHGKGKVFAQTVIFFRRYGSVEDLLHGRTQHQQIFYFFRVESGRSTLVAMSISGRLTDRHSYKKMRKICRLLRY